MRFTFREAVERAASLVANVQTAGGQSGSGVVLDGSHLVTTAQVAGPEDEIAVTLASGRRSSAAVIGVDPVYLLVLVHLETRIPLSSLPPSPRAAAGDLCLLLASPAPMERAVTLGVVSAPDLTVYRPDRIPVDGLMVTDAALPPGGTGGLILSAEGEPLALAAMPWANGLLLGIQMEVVQRVANQMLEYGSATHAWLGFSGQPEVVQEELRSLFGLPVDRGLVVNHVAPGGPGQKAGVRVFDMVVRADGQPVSSVGELRKILSRRRPGDRATITLLRAGELLDLEFPVEEMPVRRT